MDMQMQSAHRPAPLGVVSWAAGLGRPSGAPAVGASVLQSMHPQGHHLILLPHMTYSPSVSCFKTFYRHHCLTDGSGLQ